MSTIEEVIEKLDSIVMECQSSSNRLGYFAILYRQVTVRVMEGIKSNEFDDGPRMEKLDVIFAKRFIDAYENHRIGKETTRSWLKVFEAADHSKHLVLQHLLLGINAHINLDLGIAAVETIGNMGLDSIQKDFEKINQILSELVDGVKTNIGLVSPFFKTLIQFAKGKEEILVNFSIRIARNGAWKFAHKYQMADNKLACLRQRDASIAIIAFGLINPGLKLRIWIWLIGIAEWKSVPEIMDQLNQITKKI
jgi:hypothetical protein